MTFNYETIWQPSGIKTLKILYGTHGDYSVMTTDNKHHNELGPAISVFMSDGGVYHEEYFLFNQRFNKPEWEVEVKTMHFEKQIEGVLND